MQQTDDKLVIPIIIIVLCCIYGTVNLTGNPAQTPRDSGSAQFQVWQGTHLIYISCHIHAHRLVIPLVEYGLIGGSHTSVLKGLL